MIETQNDFLLGSNGESISPMFPVIITTKQQAHRTAAWIELMAVVLPDESEASTYDEIYHAIAGS